MAAELEAVPVPVVPVAVALERPLSLPFFNFLSSISCMAVLALALSCVIVFKRSGLLG